MKPTTKTKKRAAMLRASVKAAVRFGKRFPMQPAEREKLMRDWPQERNKRS